MADDTGARDFAAFREAVFDDFNLRTWLHVPLEREAYVGRLVAAGVEKGFVFDADVVRAALREGELNWLMQGCEGGMSALVDRLIGWTPFRAAWHGPEMRVDWCHLGAGRMTEPFFFETVANAMRNPFNLVFQQATSIEALAELPPGIAPAGFVFHMSRCGSTLVSQAFAAFESLIVVSEAAPLRSVLRAASSDRAGADQAARWLVGLVNAYTQPRFSYETHLVVKFMAADVLDIALVRRAFPDVPWIFVTRDPAEILASQARSAGIDLLRGQITASRLGLAEDALWTMDATAYQAHVLAAFARAGLEAHATGQGLILDHAELPGALWTKALAHFGLAASPAAVEVMRAVSRRHSKSPGTPFRPEDDPNCAGADRFRAIAEPITGPVMAALAACRSRPRR